MADSSGDDASLQIDESAPQEKRKKTKGRPAAKEPVPLETGDVVWAKVSGFSFWPAKIFDPQHSLIPDYLREPLKPTYIFVRFFGTYDSQWVSPRLVETYEKGIKKKLQTKCRSKMFVKAVKEVKASIETGVDPEGMFATIPELTNEVEEQEEEEEEEEEDESEKEIEVEVTRATKTKRQLSSSQRKKPPPAKRTKVTRRVRGANKNIITSEEATHNGSHK